MDMHRLGITIEVPISMTEAHKRQLPETIGKLIVYPIEKTKDMYAQNVTELARWLSQSIKPAESLYASPIIPFLSGKKMTSFLASSVIELEPVQLDVQTYLIRCSTVEAIAHILAHFSSETIVFLIDSDGKCAHETLVAVDKYQGSYRGHEVPFMSRLYIHGGFFFFAETHLSIEVLGTEAFLRERCLHSFCDNVLSSRDFEEDGKGNVIRD